MTFYGEKFKHLRFFNPSNMETFRLRNKFTDKISLNPISSKNLWLVKACSFIEMSLGWWHILVTLSISICISIFIPLIDRGEYSKSEHFDWIGIWTHDLWIFLQRSTNWAIQLFLVGLFLPQRWWSWAAQLLLMKVCLHSFTLSLCYLQCDIPQVVTWALTMFTCH